MPSTTAAGTAIAISSTTPTTQDAAGYGALTFVEIGQVEKLGTIGATFAKVEFQPLKGPKQKHKGSADYGSLQPSMAFDDADAGQALLRVAAADETSKLYAFRITYPTGAIRYFLGRVFGAPENVDGADSIVMSMPTVEINTKVVMVNASGTPAPAFTTQPSISPATGPVGTTFTASNGAASDTTSYSRRWLLNGSQIGTGATVTPNAAGTLVLEVTATGPGGSTSATSTVTVTSGNETLTPPAALTARWAMPYTAQRSSSGVYSIDMNIASFRPSTPGKIIYVDPVSGVNTRDGLTEATAVLDTGTALLSKAAAGDEIRIINMTGDAVARSTGAWPSAGFAGAISIVNTTPQYRYVLAAASSGTLQTWAAHASLAGVSQTTTSAPTTLIDVAVKHYPFRQVNGGSGYAVGDTLTLSNGAVLTVKAVASGALRVWAVTRLPNSLATGALTVTATSGSGTGATFRADGNKAKAFGTARRVGSVAEVAAQPGTFYHDGTVLYFSPLDGRTLTGTQPLVVVGLANRGGIILNAASDQTVYLKGVDTAGAQSGLICNYSGATPKVTIALDDATFQGACLNGLSTFSSARVVGYRPGFYYNGADGFSMHNPGSDPAATGTSGSALLVEPAAMGNGTINSAYAGANSTSDNDYTVHEEGVLTLVNPFAGGSDDRVFGFIDSSVVWVLGGFVGTAKTAADAGVTASNSIDLQGTAKLYLDGTEVLPSAAPSEAYAPKTGTSLFYRNISPAPTTSQAGTIAAY